MARRLTRETTRGSEGASILLAPVGTCVRLSPVAVVTHFAPAALLVLVPTVDLLLPPSRAALEIRMEVIMARRWGRMEDVADSFAKKKLLRLRRGLEMNYRLFAD
jgi:hypothetical protein